MQTSPLPAKGSSHFDTAGGVQLSENTNIAVVNICRVQESPSENFMKA